MSVVIWVLTKKTETKKVFIHGQEKVNMDNYASSNLNSDPIRQERTLESYYEELQIKRKDGSNAQTNWFSRLNNLKVPYPIPWWALN